MTERQRPDSDGRSVPSRPMERVIVIGNGGSGKTHLTRQIAQLLDLPVTHLDGVNYDSHWNALPEAEFADRQRELVNAPRWIIEGYYGRTLPIRLAAADTVIFLDLPAVTCLCGILQRRWRYRGRQHAEHGVYDRIDWRFVRYICRFRLKRRAGILQLLERHRASALPIRLTSRREAAGFVAGLRAGRRARHSG
jgi:adenylate kinase family enzyme